MLGALLGGFGMSAALAGGATASTKIEHYRLFTPAGKEIGTAPARILSGSCFAGSIGLPRPDAWRCFVGNEILDPCLEPPKGPVTLLVCATATSHVRLRLTKPLPRSMANHAEHTFFAWRLKLGNGDTCQRFTGTAAGSIQGNGLVYGCTSGGTTTQPTRASSGWTVRYLAKNRSPFRVKRLSQLPLLDVAEAIG